MHTLILLLLVTTMTHARGPAVTDPAREQATAVIEACETQTGTQWTLPSLIPSRQIAYNECLKTRFLEVVTNFTNTETQRISLMQECGIEFSMADVMSHEIAANLKNSWEREKHNMESSRTGRDLRYNIERYTRKLLRTRLHLRQLRAQRGGV